MYQRLNLLRARRIRAGERQPERSGATQAGARDKREEATKEPTTTGQTISGERETPADVPGPPSMQLTQGFREELEQKAGLMGFYGCLGF